MKKIISASLVALILATSLFFIIGCGNNETGEEVSFTFEIVHLDGTTKTIDVTTTKTNVGDALLEKGYIAGESDTYGLYVKTVDGETLDYNKDNAYWAFYINGEYAATGVSSTKPESGVVYSFKAEKASW